MMNREQPAKQDGLAEALHRRVDHLKLSSQARARIFAAAAPKTPAKFRYWPGLAWAAAACLLIASLAGVWLGRPSPAPPSALFKCVSVVYTDNAHVDWSRRTVMVRETNAKESYIKVVAEKPRKKEGAT